MFRLLALTLVFVLLAVAAAWLSEHPGQVVLTWLGWRIDTSAAFLLFCIAFLAALGAAFIAASQFVLGSHRRLGQHRRERNYVLGLRALTQSLVALSGNDLPEARKALKNAQKYLGEAPVTLLLEAQMARRDGNDDESRRLLETMLAHKETRQLAAAGLSDYHGRRGQATLAVPHARAAAAADPNDREALKRLVGLRARLHQWQEAEHAIRSAAWVIPRSERNRLRALLYCSRALELQSAQENAAAYASARLALKLLPDVAPIAALAARLAPEEQQNEALKILRSAWKHAPHPLLADALMTVMEQALPEQTLKAARKMAQAVPEHEESHLLLARAALQTNAWEEARQELKAALAERLSARACRMMARLEEGQYRDGESANRWRLKANDAEADPAWTCESCGATSGSWQPHCPSCHAFDTLEWKSRNLRYAAA